SGSFFLTVSNSRMASSFWHSFTYSRASAYREKGSLGLSLRKPFKISILFISTSNIWMKDLRENLDTIDQSRARPVEIGGAIDGIDFAAPARQERRPFVLFDRSFK